MPFECQQEYCLMLNIETLNESSGKIFKTRTFNGT